MSDRPIADDFDAIVHRALGDVTTAILPDPDLPNRLIANVRTGGSAVVNLGAPRRRARWAAPLLAAAVVAALAVGGVTAANLLAGPDTKPAGPGTPLPTAPVSPVPAVPVDFRAAWITFDDAEHGWAIGAAPCTSDRTADCPALLTTADGGTTWRTLDTPSDLVSTAGAPNCADAGKQVGQCVDHVLFANDSVGYLWGRHVIYVTTDGGGSWSRYVSSQADSDGAVDMVIAGDAVVRIAPVKGCPQDQVCGTAVETAPLGTVDFSQPTLPIDAVRLLGSSLGVDGDTVYLFATGAGVGDGAGIMRSNDGGKTWQAVNTNPCGFPRAGATGRVADDGALIADCGSTVRTAPPGSARFGSDQRYPPGTFFSLAAAASAQVFSVVRFDFGVDGQPSDRMTFWRTTDGGQTWQRGAVVPAGPYSFESGSVGYATAAPAGQYYVTRDGGLTWSQQPFGG